jgi:FixJ family two-component response regulator
MTSQAPSAPPGPVVRLVEDDPSARDATERLLRVSGFAVRSYGSAEELLAAPLAGIPGCILLDLRLPGTSGLGLQQALAQSDDPLPIVFLTGHGDVADSVRAMKSGAVDFLPKTVDGSALLEALRTAIARDAEDRAARTQRRTMRARYDRLTPRERQVLAHLISGQLNKQVGFDLGISERTIKIHRHQVLEKMQADSIADLVRMAADLQITPLGRVR